jgi:hypothetical protein
MTKSGGVFTFECALDDRFAGIARCGKQIPCGNDSKKSKDKSRALPSLRSAMTNPIGVLEFERAQDEIPLF